MVLRDDGGSGASRYRVVGEATVKMRPSVERLGEVDQLRCQSPPEMIEEKREQGLLRELELF